MYFFMNVGDFEGRTSLWDDNKLCAEKEENIIEKGLHKTIYDWDKVKISDSD
jgi:hypothetical protein